MAPIWSDAIAEAKWERERRNRPAGDLLFGVDDTKPPPSRGDRDAPGRSTRTNLLRRLEQAHNERLLREYATDDDGRNDGAIAARRTEIADDMLRWVDDFGNRVDADTRAFLGRDRYALLAPTFARHPRHLPVGLPSWTGLDPIVAPDRAAVTRDWFDPTSAWFESVPGGDGVDAASSEAARTEFGGGSAARRPCMTCSAPVEVDLIDLGGGAVHVTCPHCGTREQRRYLA